MISRPDDLARIATEIGERWSVEIGAGFDPPGSCSWTAPATTAEGADVVVKICFPHPEAEHEVAGLAFWDGDGMVRLLASAVLDSLPVLLLERCLPGDSAAQRLAPHEQDEVVATLLRRLWRSPAVGSPFRPLAQMCEMWAAGAQLRLARCPGAAARLLHDGIELFRALPDSATDEVVLATDLHGGNILAARREPWLAIDPKPYLGDPTYDVLQHMLNSPMLLAEPIRLVERMAGLLDLSAERLRSWAFARCAIEAVDNCAMVRVVQQLAV